MKKRLLVKTASYRVVCTTYAFAAAYAVTGKLSFAVSLASMEVISKTLLYYFHEGAWESKRLKAAFAV